MRSLWRGWRLLGVAGTIFAYVAGILFLSFVSLQSPQQRSLRNHNYGEIDTLRNRELGTLGRKPLFLQWCQELRYLDSPKPPATVKPITLFQTFPGHYVKSFKHYNKVLTGASQSNSDKLTEQLSQTTNNNMNIINNNNNNNNMINDNNNNIDNFDNDDIKLLNVEPWPNLKRNYYKTIKENSGKILGDDNVTDLKEKLPLPHLSAVANSNIQQTQKITPSSLTALVSFPGSGNTWLRYLLQQATGILTGSIYKDYGLLKSGFPAEYVVNSSVLVVKTHEWGPNAWTKFMKAILLIRDPSEAILAEFNRQSGGHIGFASPDRYKRTKGKYWNQFVKNKLLAWEYTNLSWGKKFPGDIKIIYYDNLVDDVEGTLRGILKFLNFTIDEELLSCALMRREGIYRRKKRLLTFDPYSPSMRKMINDKRAEVYNILGRQKNV